jgi:hypothetical protein
VFAAGVVYFPLPARQQKFLRSFLGKIADVLRLVRWRRYLVIDLFAENALLLIEFPTDASNFAWIPLLLFRF